MQHYRNLKISKALFKSQAHQLIHEHYSDLSMISYYYVFSWSQRDDSCRPLIVVAFIHMVWCIPVPLAFAVMQGYIYIAN